MKSKRTLAKGPAQSSSIILYEAADGKVTVKVFFARETFWLTQKTMAELFGVNVPAVNKHLANIYAEGELTATATVSKMETVQDEGGAAGGPNLGILQPGCRQRRRLPRQLVEGDSIPHLGDEYANEMKDADVLAKRDAAVKWCALASRHTAGSGGKPWKYLLIPHDAITDNMTLAGLASPCAC